MSTARHASSHWRGDSLQARATAFLAGVALFSLIVWNGPEAAAGMEATGDDAQWIWPVQGEVITQYSNDNGLPYAGGMHRGIDIAAPVGTRVAAARPGTVGYAGSLGTSGIVVAVDDDSGRLVETYLHLSEALVRRGQKVTGADTVGRVGTTGQRSAEAPHLHFGVRAADRANYYFNPLDFLPPLTAATDRPTAPPVEARLPLPDTSPVPVARSTSPAGVATPVPGFAPSPQRYPDPNLRPSPVGSFESQAGFEGGIERTGVPLAAPVQGVAPSNTAEGLARPRAPAVTRGRTAGERVGETRSVLGSPYGVGAPGRIAHDRHVPVRDDRISTPAQRPPRAGDLYAPRPEPSSFPAVRSVLLVAAILLLAVGLGGTALHRFALMPAQSVALALARLRQTVKHYLSATAECLLLRTYRERS